jgi:ABC-type phosphate transport system auxiliary subunit
MTTFIENALLVLLGGGGAGAGGWWTYLRSRKTDKVTAVIDAGKVELDERRITADAYANLQKISEDVVSGLHDEMGRLRRELKTERDGRAEDNRQRAAEILELRGRLDQLKSELDATRAQLRIAGTTTEPEGGGS